MIDRIEREYEFARRLHTFTLVLHALANTAEHALQEFKFNEKQLEATLVRLQHELDLQDELMAYEDRVFADEMITAFLNSVCTLELCPLPDVETDSVNYDASTSGL